MQLFQNIKISIQDKYYPWLPAVFVFVTGAVLMLFRYAEYDETGYLLEASIISNSIRNFKWFGDLPVGLHGFITKIPAALLFLIFGNSVSAATFVNVLFASACAYLIYLLNLKIIHSPKWSLLATFLAISSYYFVYTIPTFLRDIPALFSILLLLYLILQKSHFILIGLALLFVLDCKEYLFFVISIPLFVYLVLFSFSTNKKNLFQKLGYFVKNIFLVFSPALLLIILMFYTNLIPVNNYIPLIFGMSPKGIKHSYIEFSFERATATNKPKDNSRYIEKIENHRKIYFDRDAYETLSEAFKHIKQDSYILAITTEIIPELVKKLPGERIITYFYSIFPEKKFRKAKTAEEALEILNKFNIEAIVVFPEFKTNKYYLASHLPQILNEGKHFVKIQNPLETDFEVFVFEKKHDKFLGTETSPNIQEKLVLKSKKELVAGNKEGETELSRVDRIKNTIGKYLLKFSHPRIFSFLSVPLIIVFPAIIVSLKNLKSIKSKHEEFFCASFFLFFIILYIFRASHGRYLLAIMPITYLFFIKTLKLAYEEKPVYLKIGLLLAIPFVILNILEEDSNKVVKSVAYICFTIFLGSIAFYPTMAYRQIKKLLICLVCAIFSVFTFTSAIYGSYKIGQIGKFISFGYNGEFHKIAMEFSHDEKIWFNGNVNLLSFYRNESYIDQKRPKGAHLKTRLKNISEQKRTFYFVQDIDSLHESFLKNGIKTVALLIASPEVEIKISKHEEYLKFFLNSSWLELKKTIELKNKRLYIFHLKDD